MSPGGPFKPAAALLPTLPPDTHTLPAWSPRTSAHLSPFTDAGYHVRGRAGELAASGQVSPWGPSLPSHALSPEGSGAPRQAGALMVPAVLWGKARSPKADLGHGMSDTPAPGEGPARPTVGGRGRERGPWLPILSLVHKQRGCCRAWHPNFLLYTLADGPVRQLCCLSGSREPCRGGSEAGLGLGAVGMLTLPRPAHPSGPPRPALPAAKWVCLCPPRTRILTAQRCPRVDPPGPQSARGPSTTVPVSPHEILASSWVR